MLDTTAFNGLITTMTKTEDVMKMRRHNLRVLAEQWGGPAGLAKKLKVDRSYVSQLTSPKAHRPITEKTARHIEKVLSLSDDWLDTEHHLPAAPANIEESLVWRVFESVSKALEDAGITASITQQKKLVNHVYEHTLASGQIDEAFVRRAVDILK